MEKEQIKILYMGTPEISARVLSSVLDAGFNVIGVVCNEDRPMGRKKVMTPPPTKVVALQRGIPVYQPHRIREDHAFLDAFDVDLILTMAYGQIVPAAVLDKPKFGCLNLHGSILPKYRGAAPMQRAIIDGQKKTGCTLMEMVDKMDAGRMFDVEEFPIENGDNYTSISEKMAEAAAKLAIKDILPYINGELPGLEQNEDEVTFANKIKPEDEHLDLSLPCEAFRNWVRGLANTPGGYALLDGKKLKVFEVEIEGVRFGETGSLHFDKHGCHLTLSDGCLLLLRVQPEGKAVMDGKSFANGYRHLEGKTLE